MTVCSCLVNGVSMYSRAVNEPSRSFKVQSEKSEKQKNMAPPKKHDLKWLKIYFKHNSRVRLKRAKFPHLSVKIMTDWWL